MTDRAPADAQRALGVLFWFRNDLRLHDQPALTQAIALANARGTWLLPVWVHDARGQALTAWGFRRTGPLREAWTRMAVQDLSAQITALGSTLLEAQGDPVRLLSDLAQALGTATVVCEDIAAPEEQAQVDALRRSGVVVETVWQSTCMAPESLPFTPDALPDVFTSFRQSLARHGVRASAPLPRITALPPLPAEPDLQTVRSRLGGAASPADAPPPTIDARAAFPWDRPDFHGGERAALAHLAQYGERGLPHTYKATRNGLIGVDYSSKWSPWLATGALSARTAWAAVAAFEAEHGANEGTEWLHFELLWRDYFRWLHHKYGRRLYAASGLKAPARVPHNPAAFERWCQGQTGHPFIDAGMRELARTGYLSNRMRQNVASFLVHDLACDWRAGAAWFEATLIDHDVYSNQGNWLYLSGRGTDPRPNRRFNTALQAQTYDPDGAYTALWSTP